MIIRSQDKKYITNDMNLSIVLSLFVEPMCYEIRNSKWCIGVYSTEEKAIKVLDMIQDSYTKSFQKVQRLYGLEMYRVVFPMPSDEEV